MFVEGMAKLITNDPGVAAALGLTRSDNTSGVFPDTAPDEVTVPYVVYTQVSRETITTYAGVNRLQAARFRISCYGASYKQAKTLAQKVKGALDSFTGVLGDAGATPVQHVIPSLEADSSEPVFHGTIYGVILDYDFWYVDTGS